MPSRGRATPTRYLTRAVRGIRSRLTGPGPRAATGGGAATPGTTPGTAAAPAREVVPVLDVLRHGGSLPAALAAQARTDVEAGRAHVSIAMATSLSQDRDTARWGALVAGVVAARRGYHELAWRRLRDLPVEVWAAHAPEEYVRSGLAVDPERTLAALDELVGSEPDFVDAAGWLALLGPTFGHGALDLSRRIFTLLDGEVGDGHDCDPSVTVNRDWLRPWMSTERQPPAAEAASGEVSFAIMDYGHPGRSRASANIGDHVQSLASLGHLARHRGLEFSGPQDLVDLLHQLQGRVRPERQLDDLSARVQLSTVDRDASEFAPVQPDTWMLAFGWFMHPMFDMRYGFPFHQNLLPIFVSFHCSKRGLLTEETLEYLRRFAPIGCRDWTTVDVLLSVGVPAFFSGCMTTTVDTVFPDLPQRPGAEAGVAYVDVPDDEVPAGATTYRHSDDSIRFRSFSANTYDAIELLETYRRKHTGLVTSRLHCYLPGRSIGLPVDFRPGNRSDPRFAGLIDIDDTELGRIRSTISEKLQRTLSEVFSGASPERVYEVWREINEPDVQAAARRHQAPARMADPTADLVAEASQVASSVSSVSVDEDAVQVVVHARRAPQQVLEVLLASAAASSSRPVQFWVLTRRPGQAHAEELRRAAGGATVTVVDTRGVGSDVRRVDGTGVRPRELDLLALAELLPNVSRAVVLPVESLVRGDLAELDDLDLQGHLLAAPSSVGSRGSSGFGVLHAAGNRLRNRTAASAEFRRQGHARHRFDFDAFETTLLVLDLDKAREQGLARSYVPYIEAFGLGLREILHFEVGPHRVALPEEWYAVPNRSAVESPRLIHWAERAKPWSEDVADHQDLWLATAARLSAAGTESPAPSGV